MQRNALDIYMRKNSELKSPRHHFLLSFKLRYENL